MLVQGNIVARLEALGVAAALGYTGRRGPVAVHKKTMQAATTGGDKFKGAAESGAGAANGGVGGREGDGEEGSREGQYRKVLGAQDGEAVGGSAGEESADGDPLGWAHRRLAALFPASHAILSGGPPKDGPEKQLGGTRPLHVRVLWSPDKEMAVGAWGDYFEPLILLILLSSRSSSSSHSSGEGARARAVVLDVQTDAAEFGPPATFRTFKASHEPKPSP